MAIPKLIDPFDVGLKHYEKENSWIADRYRDFCLEFDRRASGWPRGNDPRAFQCEKEYFFFVAGYVRSLEDAKELVWNSPYPIQKSDLDGILIIPES